MVGDMVSPCPLHSSKVPCVWLPFPAISQSSRGQLYGWLPLSNAYRHFILFNTNPSLTNESCLMPTALHPLKINPFIH